jgi:transposase
MVSTASVDRNVNHFVKTGNILEIKTNPGRTRIYNNYTQTIVKEMITQKPSLYLYEIQKKLSKQNINLSITTIHRLCERTGLTFKLFWKESSYKEKNSESTITHSKRFKRLCTLIILDNH